MSLQALERAIMAEATARGEATAQTLATTRAREAARITERAREIEQAIIERAEQSGDNQARQLHQTNQLAAKAAILRAKQAELTATRDAFVAHVMAWDSAKTKRFLTSLLALIPAEGKGTIIAGEHHAALLRDLATKAKHTVAAKTLPDEGGFIYRTDTSEINVTLSNLANALFTRHKTALAKSLFS